MSPRDGARWRLMVAWRALLVAAVAAASDRHPVRVPTPKIVLGVVREGALAHHRGDHEEPRRAGKDPRGGSKLSQPRPRDAGGTGLDRDRSSLWEQVPSPDAHPRRAPESLSNRLGVVNQTSYSYKQGAAPLKGPQVSMAHLTTSSVIGRCR
jgi:hypothetical protein